MKHNIYFFLLACTVYLLPSCSGIQDDIQSYLDAGETIYVGKLDSIRISSGHNRLKIEGVLFYGMTQVKCVVNYTDPMGEKGSREFILTRDSVNQPYEFILDDLLEGQYDFRIVTQDAQGHSSIRMEASGYSYGDTYRNALVNREIDNLSDQGGQAVIRWLFINNQEVLGCNVSYEPAAGSSWREVYVPVSETTTNLSDYKPGGILRWNTVYRPDSTAIDTFVSDITELTLPE
jgi:hypothetical protein